jgi:hypothetical protein
LARTALRVILLPLVLLAVVVRFTISPSVYWLDVAFVLLLLVALVLAIVGRVFGGKEGP